MNQIYNPFDFCNVKPSSAKIAVKLPDDALGDYIAYRMGQTY